MNQAIQNSELTIDLKREKLREFYEHIGAKLGGEGFRKFIMRYTWNPAPDILRVSINSQTWPMLPSFFNELVKDDTVRRTRTYSRGLEVKLVVAPDDNLDAIAEKYSGGRNPEVILRYLQSLRSRAGEQEVQVPLQAILPKVIRNELNKFSGIDRSNCFNAGICVNEGRRYQKKYVGGDEPDSTKAAVLNEINRVGYQAVKPGGELRVGDFILYFDADKYPLHGVSYLGDGLVFTKNGFSALRPYLLQSLAAVEQIYMISHLNPMAVYRAPARPEDRHVFADLLETPYEPHDLKSSKGYLETFCDRVSATAQSLMSRFRR